MVLKTVSGKLKICGKQLLVHNVSLCKYLINIKFISKVILYSVIIGCKEKDPLIIYETIQFSKCTWFNYFTLQ
jgi:hypothetical protein